MGISRVLRLLVGLLAVLDLTAQTQVDWNTQIKNRPTIPNFYSATGLQYIWAHFSDDDQTHTRFSLSDDLMHWKDMDHAGSFSVTAPDSIRDPSITYVPNVPNTTPGTFYLTASPGSAGAGKIPIWSTRDFVNFSTRKYLDVSTFDPSVQGVFAPELWHDPLTGLYYEIMPVADAPPFGPVPFNIYIGQIDMANGLFVGTPHLITMNGVGAHRLFDPQLYYSQGTYYMIYVNQPTDRGDGASDTVFQDIAYATANNLFGPYTQQTPLNTDYFGWGDEQVEAPTLVAAPNGCLRIIVDHWILEPVGNGTSGRKYNQLWKDTCPSLGGLFTTQSLSPSQASPANQMIISKSEQGTILGFPFSDPAYGLIQWAYALTYTDQNVNGRFGVNTNNPFYTLSVKSLAAQPGFIQYNEAASIAIDPGNGDYAVMAGCGTGSGTCALPIPGRGSWEVSSSKFGGQGIMQFNNSNTDTGESGITIADGLTQFGASPLTASSVHQKAIWGINENSALYTTPHDHWFGIQNNGIGTSSLILGTFGGTPQNTSPSGCYGMQITNTSGQALNIVGLGRWVYTGNKINHQLYILDGSGNVFATYTLAASTQYAVPGKFVYTPLYGGVGIISPGATYYIMSSEANGSDLWGNNANSVSTLPGYISVNGAAFQATCGSGIPTISGTTYNSWGPLDVQIANPSTGFVGGFPLQISPDDGQVHVPQAVTLGSGYGSLYDHINYGSIDAVGSRGSFNRVNIGQGTPGDTTAAVYTGTLRLGQGVIPAGYTAWMQNPVNTNDTTVGIVGNASHNTFLRIGIFGSSPFIQADSTNDLFASTGNAFNPELMLNRATGGVRANWGLTLGDGVNGPYTTNPVYANIDASGSNGSTSRVNIGTGVLANSAGTVVTGAVDVSKYIGSRGGSNTDLAGTLTLDGGGHATRVFTNTQAANSVCVATDNTAGAAVQTFITASPATLNIGGTAAHNVTYICIAHEF